MVLFSVFCSISMLKWVVLCWVLFSWLELKVVVFR